MSYDERDDRPATEAEAHLEWHRNAGVPVGHPCPWDACHDEPLTPADRDEVYVGLGDFDGGDELPCYCEQRDCPRCGLA